MKRERVRNLLALAATIAVIGLVITLVHKFKCPDQMDVIAAQSMDMSGLKPPVGSATVSLWTVRKEPLASVVTYPGTVVPFTEQEIDARVTGRVMMLTAYPGDTVSAGVLVAQLDSAELSARAQEADAEAHEAQIAAHAAHQTEHLHHAAALRQATAQFAAATSGLADAQATQQNAAQAIDEAKAAVASAKSQTVYWSAQIDREKNLFDVGAVARQEYQNQLAQAQAADAQLAEAQARVAQATSTASAAAARVDQARGTLAAAKATQEMAAADTVVGDTQTAQAQANAAAREADAQAARVTLGYTRIVAPIAGVISERPISPGSLVQPGTVLLRIAQIDRVRVQAYVAMADLDGVATGTPVSIAVQGVSGSVRANVTSVFPSADPKTHTNIVEAVIPNPGHRLHPGAFVSMRITKHESFSTLVVPVDAVHTLGGTTTVWVARSIGGTTQPTEYECEKCQMRYSAADAKRYNYIDPMDGGKLLPVLEPGTHSGATIAHQVSVTTGASDGTRVAICDGDLKDGDLVIRGTVLGLTEGARVEAREASQNAGH